MCRAVDKDSAISSIFRGRVQSFLDHRQGPGGSRPRKALCINGDPRLATTTLFRIERPHLNYRAVLVGATPYIETQPRAGIIPQRNGFVVFARHRVPLLVAGSLLQGRLLTLYVPTFPGSLQAKSEILGITRLAAAKGLVLTDMTR